MYSFTFIRYNAFALEGIKVVIPCGNKFLFVINESQQTPQRVRGAPKVFFAFSGTGIVLALKLVNL